MTLVNATTGEVVRTLGDLEAVIERGIGTFLEVGAALAAIRDDRLYRQQFDTFEDYCRTRWGFSDSRARQLVAAAETVTAVTVNGGPAPTSERQTRALARLNGNPQAQADAMRAAVADTDGKVTAKAVEQAVAEQLAEQATAAEQHRQDIEDTEQLKAEVQPEGFDAEREAALVTQRGSFARLCKNLAALGDPAEFIADQGDGLKERHASYAEAAYGWLDTFLIEWRNDR